MSDDWYKKLKDRKLPLIKQIAIAVDKGELEEIFTVAIIRLWVEKSNIRKGDGETYKSSSIGSILSDSDVKNSNSKNKNIPVLKSRLGKDGFREYWFTDEYWDWIRSFR